MDTSRSSDAIDSRQQAHATVGPLSVSGVYALLAGVWIVASDLAVDALGWSSVASVQTVKGLVFVGVSAAVLYGLVRRWERERTSTQTALGQARRLFRSLFDRLDDAAILVDARRRIVDCNAAVERILGHARSELLGQDTRMLHVDQASYDAFSERGVAPLRDAGVFRTEFQLRRKDGHVIDTEHTVTYVDDAHSMAVSIVRDISAKKEAERVIARQSAYLNALLTNITDVVMVVDDSNLLEFISPSVERVLGYRPEGLARADVRELVHEDDWHTMAGMLAQARTDPGAVHLARHRMRTDGGAFIEVESVGLTPPGSELRGTVLCARDMTRQRQIEAALLDKEAELRQAQKMEAIGRLAGGVAHDFNNLLTVIFGLMSFIQEELPEDSPAYQDAQTVLDAAKRSAALTDQLLVFSRQRVVEPKQTFLNRVIEDMEKVVRRLVGEDVELSVAYGANPPPIFVDDTQLAQVLLNLVVNARDAMPRGGQLHIATMDVELGADEAARHAVPAGRYACLVLRDTGVGMDQATLSQIFEPFFTTKDAGSGTGLGLSTSFGIVAQAGGFIDVESTPGHGTTFRVHLPERRGKPAQRREAQRPTRPGRGETILLVEDDAHVRGAAARLLERAGYRVLAAESAERARTLAMGQHVDLLVTDVVLPGLSGRELARVLTADGHCRRVLFVSGYTPDELLRRDVAEEGTLLLRKPFTEEQLKARVRDALDKDEWLPPPRGGLAAR